MSYLIKIPTSDGTAILAEVEESELGAAPAGRPGEVVATATEKLEDAIRKIKPTIAAVFEELRDYTTGASEVELQFGLKMTAQSGVIFASTGVEGHFHVKLKWVRPAEAPAKG